MKPRVYRRYDHRLRNIIAETGDPNMFPELKIPKSTTREWVKNGLVQVITLPEFNQSKNKLIQKVDLLQQQLNKANAEKKLITKSVKILGFQIQYTRLPDSNTKQEILSCIKNALLFIPLMECLSLVGLSSARYYAWIKRQKNCTLKDLISCPKLTPNKLTIDEINKIKNFITSVEYQHFSITALSWFAKKTNQVFASPSTWAKIIREHGLKRPSKRLYPPRPKIGIRASHPGQIWHLDMSVIKITDGTRCFIQAVIDNYSRYILAWSVSKTYSGLQTQKLLFNAINQSKKLGLSLIPEVFVDSGTENLNSNVNLLIEEKLITRTIAQIDVEFSNSMIEALFSRMKHRYLYTKDLINLEELTKHVNYYLNQSNEVLPHSALKGATPLESITGQSGTKFFELLQFNGEQSRQKRIEFNRASNCGICPA